MQIEIKEVKSRRELKQFVKFNIELYKNNPYHVPNLSADELTTLDRKKNPAFDAAEAIYLLAFRDGKIAGRIAGIINHKTNEVWKQKHARFGFVDFIDDNEVVDALFNAVEKWAKDKGMEEIHGPLGFTDFDLEGMLIHGFDQLGTMIAIYNYPYYPKQLERIGYAKACDWKEFKIYIPEEIPEKHLRIGEIVKKKYGLKTIKFQSRKEIWPYAYKIFHALNAAYSPLYGTVPLSEKQIDFYVKMYIPILRLDMIAIIVREEDDAVVGFGISLPNLSHALRKANGNLFPFGFLHLLKALKSKPKVVDLYLVGLLPEYQGKGVNALLFNDLIPVYQKLGVVYAESNPELETNSSVQAQWEYFKREHHKTRRAFFKKI
jgi:GNAT superfamily N-acetyltransferase